MLTVGADVEQGESDVQGREGEPQPGAVCSSGLVLSACPKVCSDAAEPPAPLGQLSWALSAPPL